MWILFKTLIIASSVFILRYVKIDPFWKPKEGMFLFLGFMFLASCWLNKKTRRYIFDNKWLSIFFIYVVFLFGLNFLWPLINNTGQLNLTNLTDGSMVYSIPLILPEIWFTLIQTLNVILALLIIYHLVEHTDSVSRWIGVIKVVCWTGFGIAVYSLFQYFGLDQIFPKTTVSIMPSMAGKMFSFMGNTMLTANFIACITPLFLIFKAKKYYAALIVCLFTVFLFQSIFSIISVIAGICIILLLQRRWKLTLSILLGLVILLTIFKSQHNLITHLQSGFHGRTGMWAKVLEKSKDKILTGHGLGSLYRDFAPTGKTTWTRFHSSHNIFVDIIYELGVLALFIVFGYLFNLFRRLSVLFLNGGQSMLLIGLCGGFTSYLIVCMGGFPHRIAPLALLGIIYIAGIEVHLSQRRRV